jgi:hypothetical protein
MSSRRGRAWWWVLVIALGVGLFAPATLLATGSDDDYEEYETFQQCYGTSQGSGSHTNSGGLSFF